MLDLKIKLHVVGEGGKQKQADEVSSSACLMLDGGINGLIIKQLRRFCAFFVLGFFFNAGTRRKCRTLM